ncbi:ABC transporter ATP-binding protein [Bacillus licheniformis]|uniref:ABC transporter ATP-binding protein n=1 Tax=Bacillus TaxID=1386 RepID=UPI000BA7AF6F|nr:ABC transporter ATP-binding protein [Bacillus licheniformis]MBY8832462.1 ABC transporter ATP-binding protein [Bacillus licheniformis]MDE1431091.1 ABC transporter ATP-binding protein [Bacillus licheniformis]MED1078946.1 ABC transporter ATP-binding protein [Bacillus licheniformis]PAD51485.1 lantibiotic ABC transporter [Bacillus licheniformis]TWM34472.1 putative ABC transporter ATP-binding protein YxlF [Bacillus licheniformis]
MSQVEFEGVSKRIKGRPIVQNITFQIAPGTIFGLLGPNGAGKTTLIKMIAGMAKPTSGDIRIDGYSVKSNYEEAAARVGSVVENPSFYEHLTGYQNLKYLGGFHSHVSKERIEEIVQLVDLTGSIHKPVKTYSLGMKQRLGLAVALLHDPEFLILDEPTNGLDPQGIIDLREHLQYLAKTFNKTILISSHLLSEVEMICDEYGVMKNGELLQIKSNHRDTDTVRYRLTLNGHADEAADLLNEYQYAGGLTEDKNEIYVLCMEEDIMKVVNLLMENKIRVLHMKQEKQSIEQSFLELINKG